jgi:hypothetical protein
MYGGNQMAKPVEAKPTVVRQNVEEAYLLLGDNLEIFKIAKQLRINNPHILLAAISTVFLGKGAGHFTKGTHKDKSLNNIYGNKNNILMRLAPYGSAAIINALAKIIQQDNIDTVHNIGYLAEKEKSTVGFEETNNPFLITLGGSLDIFAISRELGITEIMHLEMALKSASLGQPSGHMKQKLVTGETIKEFYAERNRVLKILSSLEANEGKTTTDIYHVMMKLKPLATSDVLNAINEISTQNQSIDDVELYSYYAIEEQERTLAENESPLYPSDDVETIVDNDDHNLPNLNKVNSTDDTAA